MIYLTQCIKYYFNMQLVQNFSMIFFHLFALTKLLKSGVYFTLLAHFSLDTLRLLNSYMCLVNAMLNVAVPIGFPGTWESLFLTSYR